MRLTREQLNRLAAERILVLDGAMGTMIQSYGLGEADFRGELLADHPRDLKGNNDLLCLTRPDVITEIHRGYFAAGADIVTTNTFNGTSISQADYGTSHLVRDINLAAAKLARAVADEFTAANPGRPRFVAGSLAPTNRTCSISPDVNDPGLRNITYRELVAAYTEEAEALLDGGVDLLMVETVFDPLNAKAAVFAVRELLARRGLEQLPVWISGTVTDASGRMLTGQTPEAFWISLRHADPAVFGLNCALGADAMRPFVAEIADSADVLVSAHPNAGLPNELGGYDETPDQMAARLGEFAEAGLVNIAGGCCGTTPEFISAIAEAVRGVAPRRVPERRAGTTLAGLEPLRIDEDSLFVNVGERTNVAGSRRFARLVREGDWETALEVGRQQVRGGAQIIDVNMDDALLDAPAAMASFLNFVAGDPEIARVPVMIDSSDWKVLEAGLERIQGQGHRQLAQPEGRRGGIPSSRPAGDALRRRRGGDGLRRAGPGRHARAPHGDPDARLAHPARRGIPGRGHRLRSERLRGGYGPARARPLRGGLHRVLPAPETGMPRRADQRRHQQPQLQFPRQRRRARGDAFGLPLSCDPGGPGHGHRQRGTARGVPGDRAETARGGRGRGPGPPPRRHRAFDRAGPGPGRTQQGRPRGPVLAREAGG